MCGIIGVFGRESAASFVINGMRLISYRGRDGYGLTYGSKKLDKFMHSASLNFKPEDSSFALGHCLHAVVNKVKQPFFGKGVFAVNCEIYNWEELALEYGLEAENDAELFFLLLEKFGVERALELVNGDYAGAYAADGRIYLFRDRVGVKPLWYSLDHSFAFASERKVLRKFGYENVFELNPRELLIYDLEKNEATFLNLDFYNIEQGDSEYNLLKKRLGGYLVNAVAKRIPDVKLGLLFSGAVDSSFIALVLKKLGIDFKCYTCAVKGLEKEAEDLKYAKKAAEDLGLNLEVIDISLDHVEKELPNICRLIESNDVTKVSVAVPFYFACKKASEDDCRVILSGLGADDLFGGYARHLNSFDVNKECYHSLLNLYERDLYRDDVITMYNNIELRVPYLDRELIGYALGISGNYKINNGINKFILRDVALDYGLDKIISFRKKLAAQYGGNFLKAIEKISKKNNFRSKSEYLAGIYNEGNVKLAALFSSGKDSCYAVYVMKKQNYDIKCLVTIKSANKDSYMYHTPNVHLAELQADAMGIPIILQETSGEKEREIDDLEIALKRAKGEFGVEGVVSGALFSNYQRERIQRVAEKLGLKFFAPLWHKNQGALLKEMIANDFDAIISSIASDGLSERWLGRKINDSAVDELVVLNRKIGINVCGEGGEYESLVLDCPLFRKRIILRETEKNMENNCTGVFIVKDAVLSEKD